MEQQKIQCSLMNEDCIRKAESLVASLKAGDEENALASLSELCQARGDDIFQQLGKLAREFHESVKEININDATDNFPRIQDKLTHVLTLTENAANKTMEGLEKVIPKIHKLSDSAEKLQADLEKSDNGDKSSDLLKYLAQIQTSNAEVNKILEEVIVAQNYQDLSGQAIKKVIVMVSNIEEKLIALVCLAAGTVGLKSDDILSDAKPYEDTNLKGQDEVDDLLSSLGF